MAASATPSDPIAAVVAAARRHLDGEQAAGAERFLRAYYADVAPEDIDSRTAEENYEAAMSHLRLGAVRPAGTATTRVADPRQEEHGWSSRYTVIDVVTDDMPYLVDSVGLVAHRTRRAMHLLVHPILSVARDADGRFLDLADDGHREAWIHLEIDRAAPGEHAALAAQVESALDSVRVAIDDADAMRARVLEIADALDHSPNGKREDGAAIADLLRWLAADHFLFLGCRDYRLDEGVLLPVEGSGLGLLRDGRRPVRANRLADLSAEARAKYLDDDPLVITKANSRSPVHRDDYFEYIGVKKFGPAGEVVGEQRIIGLFSAMSYRSSVLDIPFLRRKIDAVLARSGFDRGSHRGRTLWTILETYPRDELFQIKSDELYDIAIGIANLGERNQVRLFARRDDYGRFMSCLVYVPRDRLSAAVVDHVRDTLVDAYGGTNAEVDTLITTAALARIHVLVFAGGSVPPSVNTGEVERRLSSIARWWQDELHDAVVAAHGEEVGAVLLARYDGAFPLAYRDAHSPAMAQLEIDRLETLGPERTMVATLYDPDDAPPGAVRLKLFTLGEPVTLSSVLPLLEHLGVQVIDERPYEVRPVGAPIVWLYDIGLACPAGVDLSTTAVREEFESTFAALYRGEVEPDGFNRLVLVAALTGAQANILRAYGKYLRQVGIPFSQGYLEDTLSRYPAIARQLTDLFTVRFDPDHDGHRALEMAGIAAEIVRALDDVESLDDDRILRAFLALIEATTRTSVFRTPTTDARPTLAFKFDPSRVPDLPLPRPQFEIWVYSPTVEGVHLRGGPIARGGIRWSDRREDFRTEVLGLMKAQMVKNAVIVPTGAKGGFVVKRLPADPPARAREVVACYRAFVAALLELTDNIVGGVVVTAPGVVRHDDDDPYMVVAADKGTATFSDLANSVAAEYGFWLGDAFASGGSAGYDHKAMGITARGAWESVRGHFRTVGVDADTAPITVAGIGDMSGDVFGNGMLLSRHLRLVAAFDHRHIFLDPDPDAEASHGERKRLFALSGSSWDDYDRTVISAGGGVFSRAAKAITLSDEARDCLQSTAQVVTPAELVSIVLRAPVDLLWNGGIGTYVKASTETHAEVGDRANDSVRVNGADLRCRVVAEGGNLGLTQRGRVEYALNGGFVNTDAIDNSAGVDCSDHEVNIKILLDAAVASGDMDVDERNRLLVRMTGDVAELVLEDNRAQTIALAMARTQASAMVNVHARYLRALEAEGLINRQLEFLPTDKQMAERQAMGIGLTSPEFAVLLAYTKTTNVDEVLASSLPDDPDVQNELAAYFPRAARVRLADRLADHRLHREIVATCVVNTMVNRAGTSFDHRMLEETGSTVPDVTRAYLAARRILRLDEQWREIETLDPTIAGSIQMELFLRVRQLIERGVLWLLRSRRPPLDIGSTVGAFRDTLAELEASLGAAMGDAHSEARQVVYDRYIGSGVPEDLARRATVWAYHHTSFDVVELSAARGRPPFDVAIVFWCLFHRLGLEWLWDRVGQLPRNDRWQTYARAALRDDLLGELRHLTDDALRAGDVFTPPAELIDRWVAVNHRSVERIERIFSDIGNAGVFDLTTLSVALRQLRNVVLASGPSV